MTLFKISSANSYCLKHKKTHEATGWGIGDYMNGFDDGYKKAIEELRIFSSNADEEIKPFGTWFADWLEKHFNETVD